MLFRDHNGKIICINRLEYHDDEKYYRKLIELYKSNNKEKKEFDIENTKQFQTLIN